MSLLKFADRVKESCSAPGTGTVTLLGASTGHRAFSAVCNAGDTIPVAIADQSGANWEVGLHTWNTGGTITRVAANVLAGSAGAGTLVNFSSGTQDVFLTCPAAYLSSVGPPNRLLNPSGAILQRQARSTLTGVANNSYGPDCWYLQTDDAGTSIQFRSYLPADASPPVAFPSGAGAYLQVKNNAAAARGILLVQPLEAVFSYPLLSSPVTLAASGTASAGTPTLKLGLFEWTGAADNASCKSLVASWASSVPTFNTTTLTNLGNSATALNSSTWTDCTLTKTTDASLVNLAVCVWVEALPAGASLFLSKLGLYLSPFAPPYAARDPQTDWDGCQRWYQKSYAADVAPGTATLLGGYAGVTDPSNGAAVNGAPFPTRLRAAPSFTSYSTSTGTANRLYQYTGTGTDLTPRSAASVSESGVQLLYPPIGTYSSAIVTYQWTADASL